MAGMGIHKAFEGPVKEAGYYEDFKRAKLRAKQFDEDMQRGKEEALRFRAAQREAAKRKAFR